MEKYFLKNGKEVKIGDALAKEGIYNHPLFGDCKTVQTIAVTEDSLPILIKEGIVIKKDVASDTDIPMSLTYYMQKIADKLGWKVEKVANYLTNADTILPAAAFSMILREIAIELDKKYVDHICNSPEIYVVSMLDSRITKANKANIKNYRNFAAFRSIEDARIACRITKDILKEMFKSGK